LNNQQYLCPQTVVILPTEMTSFTTSCFDEKELINWSTASEDRVDYFEVEYTFDGIIFFPIAQVEAAGTTVEAQHYSVTNNQEITKQVYYRIKTVDLDGNIDMTDLISGKKCKQSQLLNSYIFENGNLLLDLYSADVTMELLSPTGQLISQINGTTTNGLQIAQGVYLLKVNYAQENRVETFRLFHTRH
jgi:hypothetical protein